MEEKLNMKIYIIDDDREIVGNTVTQKKQSCEIETEQRRLRGCEDDMYERTREWDK